MIGIHISRNSSHRSRQPVPSMPEALAGVKYPASVDDIVARAVGNNAAQPTIALLRRLKRRLYRNERQVQHDLGAIEETPPVEELWSTAGSQELEDQGQQSTTTPIARH
jgi:hypothetical protein